MLGRRPLLVIPAALIATVLIAGCGPGPDATASKQPAPPAANGDASSPSPNAGGNSMKPQKLAVDPSK